MTSGERVALIQQRIREVQKRWTELKMEVAHLDRKRRRARRKEREGKEGIFFAVSLATCMIVFSPFTHTHTHTHSCP